MVDTLKLEYTETVSRDSSRYYIGKVIGSNDVYVCKESFTLDREGGHYIEPIGKHGERGGDALCYYHKTKENVMIPGAYTFIKRITADRQVDKYIRFFKEQKAINSGLAEFMDDL